MNRMIHMILNPILLASYKINRIGLGCDKACFCIGLNLAGLDVFAEIAYMTVEPVSALFSGLTPEVFENGLAIENELISIVRLSVEIVLAIDRHSEPGLPLDTEIVLIDAGGRFLVFP